jgi:hypothetical protein
VRDIKKRKFADKNRIFFLNRIFTILWRPGEQCHVITWTCSCSKVTVQILMLRDLFGKGPEASALHFWIQIFGPVPTKFFHFVLVSKAPVGVGVVSGRHLSYRHDVLRGQRLDPLHHLIIVMDSVMRLLTLFFQYLITEDPIQKVLHVSNIPADGNPCGFKTPLQILDKKYSISITVSFLGDYFLWERAFA